MEIVVEPKLKLKYFLLRCIFKEFTIIFLEIRIKEEVMGSKITQNDFIIGEI